MGVGFVLVVGVGEMGVKELWMSGCDMWGLIVMVVFGVFLGDRFGDSVVLGCSIFMGDIICMSEVSV